MFHALRWPGTDSADIDHAVIVGDRLAIIDTKNWKSGRYYWDGIELYRV
ncbi:nuclease-related domain-containing protein [Cellulomonas xiejunii]|nr:nuclease-related domain-containing protein [Cellulomonas xiejunii]MCC2313280.1 NERD domain-containing protein [Cellulomonas xiejunii]